jgi:hypothetical protein
MIGYISLVTLADPKISRDLIPQQIQSRYTSDSQGLIGRKDA